MNVAVIEQTSSFVAVRESHESESEWTGHQSEWIDPDGNDWLSSIYWELTHDSEPEAPACTVTELEHWWFG